MFQKLEILVFVLFYQIWIWYHSSMIFSVSLYLVPGDASFETQSKTKWIFHSVTVYVSYWVVPGDEILSTQSRAIWSIPIMTLHVLLM